MVGWMNAVVEGRCIRLAILAAAASSLVLGCESGPTAQGNEEAQLTTSMEAEGEPVLQGEPGEPTPGETLDEYPQKSEVDALVETYDGLLTQAEAQELLLGADSLPTAEELDAFLTVAEATERQAQAMLRDAANTTLVPKAAFPDPATQDLLTIREADAAFASFAEANALTVYATPDDAPNPDDMLNAETATELYEPIEAWDTVAKQTEMNAQLQATDGALAPELEAQIRAIVRKRRYLQDCPEGMTAISDFCVDTYEANLRSSVACQGPLLGVESEDLPTTFPPSGAVAPGNELYACSAKGVSPARFVTWFQAQQACSASGKRLCTNSEWQLAAIGTETAAESGLGGACDGSVGATPYVTGDKSDCTSQYGVFDMAGNLGEWTAEWASGLVGSEPRWVQPDDFTATDVWPEGYGDGADATHGMNTRVSNNGGELAEGLPAGVVRGIGGADAGAYSLDWTYAVTTQSPFIGFRCCRNRY